MLTFRPCFVLPRYRVHDRQPNFADITKSARLDQCQYARLGRVNTVFLRMTLPDRLCAGAEFGGALGIGLG